MAGVGHFKRIRKDACRVAGAIQETCSSEMLGGQATDFLRGLHVGASDLQVSASCDLASLFRGRRSTLDRWRGKTQNAVDEAISSSLNFPYLKEVSQNSFVFDVVKFKK